MKLATRFSTATLIWATGIFLLILAIGILGGDQRSAAHIIRWLARALTLAAFPAGIAVAPAVFSSDRPTRSARQAIAAAAALGVVIFLLLAVVAPALGTEARGLAQLATEMRTTAESWETRNDAAWVFFTTFFAPLNAFLYAAIGIQVGIWGTHWLRPAHRRALYWFVGLGLLITGAAIWDTTYETIVLHTAADANFAALYTILAPLCISAGLALPTLALLRGGAVPRSDS